MSPRQLFNAYLTRVATVCYLLKAGLSETVVLVLAHWSSQQVQRYANRLILDLGLVEAFGFYNPISLSGAYDVGGIALARLGTRKRKS